MNDNDNEREMVLDSGILIVGATTIKKMQMKIHITVKMINTINRIFSRKEISDNNSNNNNNLTNHSNITLTNNNSTIPINNNNNSTHQHHQHLNHREDMVDMNPHNLEYHKIHITILLLQQSIHHNKKREMKMTSINLKMIVTTMSLAGV